MYNLASCPTAGNHNTEGRPVTDREEPSPAGGNEFSWFTWPRLFWKLWLPELLGSVHNNATSCLYIFAKSLLVSPSQESQKPISQMWPFCLECHVTENPERHDAMWEALAKGLFLQTAGLASHVSQEFGVLWHLWGSHTTRAVNCLLMFFWKPSETCAQELQMCPQPAHCPSLGQQSCSLRINPCYNPQTALSVW